MSTRPDARTRLLDAGEELFAADGFAATPVDRVLARADVSPATLYAHFGSKTGLQQAVLTARLERWDAAWSRAVAAADDDRGRLMAVFEALEDFRTDGPPSRWCAFLDAAAGASPDDPTATAAITADTALLRDRLTALAGPVAGPRAGELAEHLLLVVSGALAMALRSDRAVATAQGRATAAVLVDAFAAGRGAVSRPPSAPRTPRASRPADRPG